MLQPIKSNTIGTPQNGNMMAMGNGGQLGLPAQPDTTDPVRAPQMGNLFQQAGQQQPATGAMGFDTTAAAGPMKEAGQVNVGDQSLVSRQITSLLSQDSPYIQLAKTRALQESNARGLANSSMAIGAGQAAAIDRALPIAQQDASTFATADRFNVEQGNLFSRDANNFGRESSLRKLGIFADMEAQGRDQTFRAGESALDRTFRRDERIGGQEFQSGESALERQFRTGERVGSQEFQSGENALDRRFRTDERIGSQEFQSGERRESQGFQAGENALERTFRSGERIGAQEFQSGENALQRAFQTGERVSDQDFRSVQAVLDREQQLRVQQLQESGMDGRQAQQIAAQERSQRADQVFTGEQRELDRRFQSGESALDRTFRSSERVSAQEFQSGESALQRAFQTGERIGDQDFRGAQAVLDREQQTRIQQLQDTGMDRRQAEQIAAQERSQRADQVFSSEQRQMDRDFTAGQSALDRTFSSERDAVNFSRELERMGFASKLEQSRLAPQFTLAIAERTQAGVQAILADPNISPEDKRVAIQNMVDYQNNTLAWAETFFGVSINKMPGGAPAPGQAPGFTTPGAVAPMPSAPAATAPAGWANTGGGLPGRFNEDIFGAALPQ